MRQLTIMLLAVAALIFLASGPRAHAQSRMQTINGPGYSFQAPSDWSLYTLSVYPGHFSMAFDPDPTQTTVAAVQVIPNPTSDLQDGISEALQDGTITVQPTVIQVAGADVALEAWATFSDQGGLTNVYQIAASRGTTVYYFSLQVTPSWRAANPGVAGQILNSFQLTP